MRDQRNDSAVLLWSERKLSRSLGAHAPRRRSMTYQGNGALYRNGTRLTTLAYSLDKRRGVISGIIVVDDERLLGGDAPIANVVLHMTTHRLMLQVTVEHKSPGLYAVVAQRDPTPLP
jgi:hypothetical protein